MAKAKKFDAKKMIMNGAAALEVQLDHAERAKWTNASEIGTCLRKQWYRKHQPEKADRDERGYARRGHHMEEYMVKTLVAANVPMDHYGREQITLQDPKSTCSGTADAYIHDVKKYRVGDFKSIDPRFNRANFPKPHHVIQVQVNMALARLHLDLPAGMTWGDGLLIYQDASDYDDIIEFDIELDPGILEKMKKRGAKALKAKSPASIDREGKKNGGKECNNECDFKKICGVQGDEPTGKGKANKGSKIDGYATDYIAADVDEKAAKAIKAGLKEDITTELAKRKMTRVSVGDSQIILESVAGRSSFDKKAAEADGVKIDKYTSYGSPSTRLTVKKV